MASFNQLYINIHICIYIYIYILSASIPVLREFCQESKSNGLQGAAGLAAPPQQRHPCYGDPQVGALPGEWLRDTSVG